MSYSREYIEGFRKTAEQYGVDPDALLKQAQRAGGFISRIGSMIGRAGQAVRASGARPADFARRMGERGVGAVSRYAELLRGGNDATLKDLRNWRRGLSELEQRIVDRVGNYGVRKQMFDGIEDTRNAVNRIAKAGKGSVSLSMPGAGQNVFTFNGTPEMAAELRKVRNARLATAAGGTALVGGAGYAATRPNPDNAEAEQG